MKAHTVLIVDDVSINRRILHKMLEGDYEILEAENGKAALELLHENADTVSAVLLDIVMPVMDGYGVLKAMQGDAVLSKIPVIVSSQKDGDEAEVHALSLGAQDFIAKPYKHDIIRHRLENLIRLRETAAIVNKVERDELTGLLSKQFFLERVAEKLRTSPDRKFDLISYDIARFKLVNDTYGVSTGDELLRFTAGVLTDLPGAVFTSRFSADHFYQLSERDGCDRDKIMSICLEKLKAFPAEMVININCGVYRIEDASADVNGMCDRAKLASDANRGRADMLCSVYDDSIRQRLLEEQFITGSMNAALEEKQFIVYYQPKYDLHTEMIAGAEALVRWMHPEKGFLSPGAFIPLFEKNGFITRLDRYVWEKACSDIRSWIDNGYPPVPVSVNVSRADIFNPNLADILLGLVKKYNIPIPYLHLEITESAYTDNPEQIVAVVGKLHELGFVIEMDDFGSGYSSLNMLAELPVDILKLDMRFVQTESANSSGRGIMSFVISLAKWMRLSVIAEGVETSEQITSLRSMDCNFVQGFYFAKPMPKEEFEKLLATVAVSGVTEAENERKKEASATDTQSAAADAPGKNGRELLIVDDIELNRAVLSEIFRHEYIIVEKENGQQALEYLKQNREKIDAVLLDLLMPVMDGFQLLDRMKTDAELAGIPVVVTSQGDLNAEERALETGADDFVSKPYSPSIVKHRVQNVISMYRIQHAQRHTISETRKREMTLMDSIPGGVAIYHLKKDGRVTAEYVSEGLAKLCGYTAEEFLDYLRDDAVKNVAPEDVDHLRAAAAESVEKHTSIHDYQHIFTKSGEKILVRFDANLLLPGENINGHSADDVHPEEDDAAVLYAVQTRESDTAEGALREQNRYRYILDNLDIAYFEIDDDKKIYASDKFSLYAMSDKSFDNIIVGNGDYSTVHPEDLPKLFEFFARKQKKLPSISAVLRLKMKDGSYRWTEIKAFLEYDSAGNCTKNIGVFRDVDTEWQNQNRKLADALNVAETANRAKTEFLARVSHEMRTPLNGILGITELLSDKAEKGGFLKELEELRLSGKYLFDLISDTLDVSSIEQGRMQLHPTVCDGRTAFYNMISLIKPSMEKKKISFTTKAEKLPFTKLYIDIGRVEQTVINILLNAVKFTPEGGKIEFGMENISTENGVITDRITVSDNGIGMSPEFIPHIFEPFAQEHSGNSTAYEGAGLGMTIAKQCVEQMGGSISVESRQGYGTTVSVVLPMPVATKAQLDGWSPASDDADLSALKNKRVLLCEDHPLNAEIARRLLEKKGVKVDHAENGKVAVEKFRASEQGYYDAILMDIRMPVMDGLEATRRIRSMSRRRDASSVPIIAMTANALIGDVKSSLDAGMTEHLGKPVEPSRLYQVLAELITKPNPFEGRKILVVDDLEMNRALVKKAIVASFSVIEAGSGGEALQILNRENDIAGVITDVQMPGMDGKELIKAIRSNPELDRVAILANTIYGDHRQEDELLALGANDFVYKPASPQILLMRLEHILRNMD